MPDPTHPAEDVATEEGISAYPTPSQVDAVEALAYVMATLSGVVEAHLRQTLSTRVITTV